MRRLEVSIPGLREKLAPDLDLRLEKGSFSRSTGHNILGRVEMLEDALELLLTAQVSGPISIHIVLLVTFHPCKLAPAVHWADA